MHQAAEKERGSVASTRAAAMTALMRFIHLPLAADHQVPSPASPTSHYPFVLDSRSETSMKAARFLQSEVHEILPGPFAAFHDAPKCVTIGKTNAETLASRQCLLLMKAS